MECRDCGGLVKWVGSLLNNPSTKCLSCGAENSQVLEDEERECECEEICNECHAEL